MRVKTLLCTLFVVSIVLATRSSAAATDKFKFNEEAWKGITFAQLFGNPTVPLPDTDPCAAAPNAPTQGMTLGVLVDHLSANITGISDPKLAELKKAALESLSNLQAFLDKSSSLSNNHCLKNWYVRAFYEDNLKKRFANDADVVALFEKYFEPIETAQSLTLPWLSVAANDKNTECMNLIQGTAFIERLGSFTYPDIFETGMSPAIDEEMIYLARKAEEIGLLGSFLSYGQDPTASVTMASLGVSPKVTANGNCCVRTTKKCTALASYYCVLVNNYCSLVSQYCP